jgi:hypothetical protein
LLFAADPLHVGIVYIETDFLEGETGNTSDEIADRFLLSFNGGAPQTELREIRLSLDKDADGLTMTCFLTPPPAAAAKRDGTLSRSPRSTPTRGNGLASKRSSPIAAPN